MKNEISSKTLELILKYGIKSVSMDDISRHLSISKKTIYQYFDNKKDLISHTILVQLAKDESEVNAILSESLNALDELIAIARHTLRFLRGMSPSLLYDIRKYYPSEWDKIEEHHNVYFFSVVVDNMNRGISEGLYKLDIDVDIISKLYVHMTNCIADEDIFPLEIYRKDQLFQELITYHIRGILSDKGRSRIDNITFD